MSLFGARKGGGKLPRAGSEGERLAQLLDRHGVGTVVDVGANEGQYGQRLIDGGWTGRIVSVEPGSGAHAGLVAAAAGVAAWTVAPRMALGAEDGEATLHTSGRSDMNSLLEADEATSQAFPKFTVAGAETVPLRRFDSVFAELVGDRPGQVFLKLDTQGFEAAVLDGAEGVLDRIVGMQLELSLLPMYRGETLWLDLATRLDRAGFELHLVLPGFFSRELGRQLQFDGVFFRLPA